jgi:hypothetical protein
LKLQDADEDVKFGRNCEIKPRGDEACNLLTTLLIVLDLTIQDKTLTKVSLHMIRREKTMTKEDER